jgi:RimJ/RimL family protein N-acetyltransferase
VVRLETSRLLLTPLAPRDESALHALWNDAEVGRYLWDGQPVAPETVREVIAASQDGFARRGFGLFGLRLRARPEELIGFAGLRETEAPQPGVELLFGLLPAHWGAGLATEAAAAVLRLGFERAGLDTIWASADAPNARSFGVMERLGMEPAGGAAGPLRSYRLTRGARERPQA